MSENEAPLFDLSSLDFRPSWAKEEGTPQSAPDYSKYEDRPPRSFDKGRPHGRDRGPRRDGGGGRGRDDRRRSPDSRGKQGDHRGSRHGGRHKGHGGKFSDRRHEERPVAPQNLFPWLRIGFAPTEPAVEMVVQQVRHTGKTFGLFEIARILLRNNASFNLELSSTSKFTEGPFYVVTRDKSVWLSRDAAVLHLLRSQVSEFYRVEEVTVAPPKGNFPAVGVCGFSGVLLGPPNLHDYERRIRDLHREKFSNMSFERYRSRIKMERDTEVVERWRVEASKALAYFPLSAGGTEEVTAVVEEVAAEAPIVEENVVVEAAEEVVAGDVGDEVVESVEAQESEAVPEESSVDGSGTEGEVSQEEIEVDAVAASSDAMRLDGLEAVQKHFIENFADVEIVAVAKAVVSGNPRASAVDQGLGPLLNYARKEEEHFPLSLVQGLSRALSTSGLRFFKSGTRTTYVSGARPRYLNLEEQVVSDSIRKILETIREKKSIRRGQLLDVLAPLPVVAKETGEVEKPKSEKEVSASEDAPVPVEETAPVEVSVPVEVAPAEKTAEQIFRDAVVQDLLWLTHEGYVIEYSNGRLEAVPPPKAKPVQAPAETAPAESAVVAEALVVEESPVEAVSVEETATVGEAPVVEEPQAVEAVVNEEAPVETEASQDKE